MLDEPDRARRAVLYLRVASSRPNDARAVDRQREGCNRIAEKYGLAVVREYVDYVQPAHLGQQNELRRLLGELDQCRDAAHVVVWNYARLARDMAQLEALIGFIRSAGAEVVTITGVEAAERFIRNSEFSGTQDEGRAE